ncbi:histidine-protein kinase/phosphatase MprB [Seminavis robusta]|uniref:histidine kinase n=1 Tax=Seminavis robusta TaxID=568900 RepID=A0A9N8EJN4_9STRA|nr:histidine-protein kinase/phosphatase MprB [Seminavis robusta]|eukprot:Sro1108_g242150.1 histidine-protein kinase/phosphatase MprB (629) ;mRNA; r:5234-7120
MPSDLFQQLALSQLELLANSLVVQTTDSNSNSNKSSKIGSMALYLPQENSNTGQLEFLPAVIYPHPSRERVFIASEADSGVAARLPRLLTKLPGFAAPDSLLPRYPMVSSNIAGVGVAEEVLCDVQSGAPALSVPLFMGSQTVGVLLVSPAIVSTTTTTSSSSSTNNKTNNKNKQVWSEEDRAQIIRAAQTLSMALSMDTERSSLALENKRVQDALSNSLHQVKNPLQALRTFGKLLQQRVAEQNEIAATNGVGTIRQLLDLTANLVEQSDRVVNLLAPMDRIVESMEENNTPLLYLNPARPDEDTALVLWNQTETTPPAIPWEIDTLEFARSRGESASNAAAPPQRSKSINPQTLEFSSSNRRSSRNSTVEEFSRRKPSGARRKKAFRQKHMMGEVTHFERGNSRRNNNNRPTTTTTNSESASSASIVGNDGLEIGFVADVLGPTLNAYKVIGGERGISFQVLGLEDAEELPGVFVRPKSLKEAFSNIVDNAFKYVAVTKTINDNNHPERNHNTNNNEEPIVRVHLKGNDDPPGVTILVEDNGPGILPEEAEAVFQRGYRSSSVSSWVLGTGLGLGLARALVESMGGRLECLDQRDKQVNGLLEGAAFQIELYRNKDRLRSEDFASE